MAAKIKRFYRPSTKTYPDGVGAPPVWAKAQHIIVVADVYANAEQLVRVALKEFDHAGIIAEYEAGAATTILQAALTTQIQSVPSSVVEAPASPGARAKIGSTVVWPTI